MAAPVNTTANSSDINEFFDWLTSQGEESKANARDVSMMLDLWDYHKIKAAQNPSGGLDVAKQKPETKKPVHPLRRRQLAAAQSRKIQPSLVTNINETSSLTDNQMFDAVDDTLL